VPVALGLGEGDLVRGDGEGVGALDAALDLDVVDEAALVGGLDVVAGVVARHLDRFASECSLGGEHGFDGTPLDLLGLAGDGLRFRLGVRHEESAGDDECGAADDGGHGDKVGGLVELFEPVAQAFIELSGTYECGLGAEPADGASAFECFEAVVFAVPVVDLCQQAILHLRSGARGLDIEAGLDLVHAGLEPFAVGPGTHELLVVLPRPVASRDLGYYFGLRRVGSVVVEVRRCCGDGDGAVLFEERVVEVVRDRVGVGVLDALLDAEHQHRSICLLGASVDQHRALLEGEAEVVDGGLDHGMQQRMTRRDEGGVGEPVGVHA